MLEILTNQHLFYWNGCRGVHCLWHSTYLLQKTKQSLTGLKLKSFFFFLLSQSNNTKIWLELLLLVGKTIIVKKTRKKTVRNQKILFQTNFPSFQEKKKKKSWDTFFFFRWPNVSPKTIFLSEESSIYLYKRLYTNPNIYIYI